MIEVRRAEKEKKSISEMTEKEILRQQLELLAERSTDETCTNADLVAMTEQIIRVSTVLQHDGNVFL